MRNVRTLLIAILCGFCTALAGCSGGGGMPSPSLGYGAGNNSGQSSGGGGFFSDIGALFKSDTPEETRTASRLPDAAPEGSWRKANGGALAGRDYGGTRLNSDQALALVNAYREQNGLKPVALHPLLVKAAKAHSTDLARHDRISHYGSDGSNPWDRVKRTGYRAQLAAENVGTGQMTVEEVMVGWKKSEAHNRNLLLKGARHAGIALVQDDKTEFKTFWTLVLGAEM